MIRKLSFSRHTQQLQYFIIITVHLGTVKIKPKLGIELLDEYQVEPAISSVALLEPDASEYYSFIRE